MDNKNKKVPLGFKGFDDPTGGLDQTDLVVITGPFKNGKSTFVLNSAIHMAQQGMTVAILDLETPSAIYCKKLFSNLSQVPYRRIVQGKIDKEEKIKISSALEAFNDRQKGARFHMFNAEFGTVKVSDIKTQMLKKVPQDYPLECLFIDPFSGLLPKGPNAFQHALEELKSLAVCRQFPIVVTINNPYSMVNVPRYFLQTIESCADYVLSWPYDKSEVITETIIVRLVHSKKSIKPFKFKLIPQLDTCTIKDY